MKRISVIKNIDVESIALSSVFHIGDAYLIKPRVNVFAVQREIPIFWANEGNLNKYDIFKIAIPKPIITESVDMKITNKSPFIQVDNIKILGISSSAIVQIGSSTIIDSEARTKHIRYLMGGERPI